MSKGIKAVFLTKLTDVDTRDLEGVGTIRIEGSKVYKYVKIAHDGDTVAGAKGDPVAYEAVDGYSNHHVVIDLADADNPAFCAGVLQGTVAGVDGTSYYGWIQVKGEATLLTSVTNAAAGAPCTMVATDKTWQKAAEADSTAVYKQVCGISINTTTGVVVDCPW